MTSRRIKPKTGRSGQSIKRKISGAVSRKTNTGGSHRAKSGNGAASRKKTESANLLLRDVAPDVLEVLKDRARRSGRSLQQELHIALRRDVHRNFDEARAITDAWHERLKGRRLADSTELLREERQR